MRAREELARDGTLRAGINLSNPLLVSGRTDSGEPDGVSPALARAIADRLGAGLALVPYASPVAVVDAAEAGEWDVALIGSDAQRSRTIRFSPPYVEIPATYLVRPESGFARIADVDAPGVTVVAIQGSAYGLWLAARLRHATLLDARDAADAVNLFARGKGDVLAGLAATLPHDAQSLPGARVLDGRFAAVRQAVGTHHRNRAGAAFLRDVVQEVTASGLVGDLIAAFGMEGSLHPAELEENRE